VSVCYRRTVIYYYSAGWVVAVGKILFSKDGVDSAVVAGYSLFDMPDVVVAAVVFAVADGDDGGDVYWYDALVVVDEVDGCY